MNPGDKVKVTYGPHKGSVGELMEYKQHTVNAIPHCTVQLKGFRIAIDPWDIEPYEEETNEADTTSASNL